MKLKGLLCLQGVALILAGCAALPTPPAEVGDADKDQAVQEPAAPLPSAALPSGQIATRAPAVTALLAKARGHRVDGEYEQATVSLERALRISARDPEVWLELAGTRFDADDFDAALQFAEKARQLAGNNEAVLEKADKLSLAARRRAP